VIAWLLALLLALLPTSTVDPPDETLRIAVVGDSISCGGLADTAGWCPELSRLLPDVELLPRAVGGTRCSYWTDHIGAVLAEDPDLVILGCGTNDGGAQLSAADVQAAVASVANQVHAAGARLLVGIPSYSSGVPTGRPELPVWQHEAYGGIRAAFAQFGGGAFSPAMFDDTRMSALTRFQIGDGVHPTAEGYKVLAHNRYRALQAFIDGLPDIGPDCMQLGHAPGEPTPRGIPCYGRPGV
jgi:lysophospholipase L1-like esterase